MCLCCYITCYLLYVCTTTNTLSYATLISCWARSHLLLQHKIVSCKKQNNQASLGIKSACCFLFYCFLLWSAAACCCFHVLEWEQSSWVVAFQDRFVVLTVKGQLWFQFTSFEPKCWLVFTSQVYWSKAAGALLVLCFLLRFSHV